MIITIENDTERSGKTTLALKIAQMLQPEYHQIWYHTKTKILPYLPTFIKQTPVIFDNLDVSYDLIIFDEVVEGKLMGSCKSAIIVK